MFVHCPHGIFFVDTFKVSQEQSFSGRVSLAPQKYIVVSAESFEAGLEVQLSLKGLLQH